MHDKSQYLVLCWEKSSLGPLHRKVESTCYGLTSCLQCGAVYPIKGRHASPVHRYRAGSRACGCGEETKEAEQQLQARLGEHTLPLAAPSEAHGHREKDLQQSSGLDSRSQSCSDCRKQFCWNESAQVAWHTRCMQVST